MRQPRSNKSPTARSARAEKQSQTKRPAQDASQTGQPGPLPQRAAKPAASAFDEPLRQCKSSAGPVHPDSMSSELIEFLTAIDQYKRNNQRPFPSWSEILEILKSLGYQKSA